MKDLLTQSLEAYLFFISALFTILYLWPRAKRKYRKCKKFKEYKRKKKDTDKNVV